MAEKVQQRIEKRLPELEDLLVKELFSQEELNHIIKKRKAFEFAISRRITQKADYLRYIEYEINLEQLRVKRKSRLSKSKTFLSSSHHLQTFIHFSSPLACNLMHL